MVHGIGTDILKIDHLKPFINNWDDPFIVKTYTNKELKLIYSREVPLNSLATRFAGKEAVFKSLGIHGDKVSLNEIEILEHENGQPTVALLGNTKTVADHLGITHVLISLSYDTEYAIAYATSFSKSM